LGISLSTPVNGAFWAARGAVTFADIALAEMESGRMRGYGKLSDEAARKIDGNVAELRGAVDKLGRYLAQGAGTDLRLCSRIRG